VNQQSNPPLAPRHSRLGKTIKTASTNMHDLTRRHHVRNATLTAVLLLTYAGFVSAQTAAAPPVSGSSALQLPAAVRPEAPQQRRGFGRPERGVYKARITSHWFQDNTRFWYRNDLSGGAKEFILVDAEKGTRQPAFDHGKLAAALSKAAGEEFKADHLPFSDIQFVEDGKAVKFEAAGTNWQCDLSSYACAPAASAMENSQSQGQNDGARQGRDGRGYSRRSPDGQWTALVRNDNVYIRAEADGKEIQLSQDGVSNNTYRLPEWSPDSQALVAWRVEPGDIGDVYLVQSSPPGGGRARLQTRPYAQAGDKFPHYELNVFEMADHKQIKPEVDRFEHEWETPQLHWEKDNIHLTYQQEDRGHQRMRLIEVDDRGGAVRNLVDERTKTFFWTAHMEGPEGLGIRIFSYLTNSDEIIYASERDGWRHLYLVDPKAGGITNQITKGDWVVRGINYIDEARRQIWFLASGMNPGQDPYFLQYYRINFDGSGLVALTDGNGNHTVQLSPDRKYLIDTYSRADMAPVNELRRCSDGALVCKLEEADISELKATGWKPPEVLVAKGRDGKTDIWGNIYRPRNFDPAKKYPVLEDIYAGPQDSYTPKSFSGADRYSWYNEHGFIVVKLDGMGTANRSKAFHDVCWHDLKDGGFPDRILWIKAAAAKYPYMDLDRVGIFGTSSGAQSAAGAVLFHPEFYKVAVANSGCHDNRLDKASWNEQWMGYLPHDKLWSNDPDNWYSQSSNIDNAAKLKGKLLLIVGEMDSNVPPESTMRFVDALIKANKDFDMLEVPGANHGAGSWLTTAKTHNFFLRNLLHEEPTDDNESSAGTGSN
jgi:dipeptidyl aminopeptidase/acylaminoacyl peptidase